MSADLRCTGTPISWLRLEQLHAKELSDADTKEIRAHLEECAACAACLARIDADAAVPLAPLPAPVPVREPDPVPAKVSFLRRAAPALTALAVAAGILFFMRRPPPPGDDDAGVGPARIKGGDVSFVLVRDDGLSITDVSATYRDGDRFKAIVTCPPGANASFDVAVYEAGKPAFPLPSPAKLDCGNAIALPGAFKLTGREELTVCLVWNSARDIDRANPTPSDLAFPTVGRLCKVLTGSP